MNLTNGFTGARATAGAGGTTGADRFGQKLQASTITRPAMESPSTHAAQPAEAGAGAGSGD